MKSGRLLLVDDDTHLLDSMASWLREQGYFCLTARTCSAALEQLRKEQFDLVIVDIRLSSTDDKADGFEVLAWCRQNRPELMVVLMTGYGTVETGIDALRAGAFDLLTKPLIDEELEMSIQRALAQRTVVEENHKLKAQLDLR